MASRLRKTGITGNTSVGLERSWWTTRSCSLPGQMFDVCYPDCLIGSCSHCPRSGSLIRPHTALFTRLADAQINPHITLSTSNVSKVTVKDQIWITLDSTWTLAKSCSAQRV
jgi:hypothetical protein